MPVKSWPRRGTPDLGAGEAGKATVVAVGRWENRGGGITVPVAVRNRTTATVRAELSAARNAAGGMIASGSDQGTHPGAVASGEVALGFVYFSTDADLPKDAKFDFTVSTSPERGGSFGKADLRVTEANKVGARVVGSAVNDLGKKIQGPYAATVFCFEGATVVGTHGEFARPDGNAAPGATETFSVDLFDRPCPTFLVGVSGYFSRPAGSAPHARRRDRSSARLTD